MQSTIRRNLLSVTKSSHNCKKGRLKVIVYEASKRDFMNHVTNDEISILIDREYKNKIGKSRENEFRAWDNSMLYMFKALNTHDIPDECGVAIEYRIPATSRRVDFILTGLDENDMEVRYRL